GVAISPAITVQIVDEFGNLTTSTANVSMAIGTNPGSGTLSGTTTIAAVGGVATFGTLSINKAGTGYTLTAASSGLIGDTSTTFSTLSINKAGTGYTLSAGSTGLTGATSSTFNITAAAPALFVVAGYPSPTLAGDIHTFTVTAKDAFGNTADNYTGTVTFTST